MATATNMQKISHTRNEFSREVRGQMIPLLNQQLADTLDLRSQAK